MLLTFIHPEWLWLLLLLVPVWALALVGPRRLRRARFWASLGLRSVVLLSLVLALAGTQVVRAVGATTTVFLLDGSDSVALSQRAQAETFIQQALAAMPNDDKAGIVVFGRNALVERTPSADKALGQVRSQPGGGLTDIASALQLGLALLPAESHQRLVLLSDGGENSGDAQAAARLAASRGIPIDIVGLTGQADGIDAQISRMQLPAAARAGQQLRLQLTLESNRATSGRLIISGPDGKPITDQQVAVPQGKLDLELNLPEPAQAFSRYTARLEVAGDARSENNVAEAYTFISGKPRVLLVEGTAGAAQNLAAALTAAAVEINVIAADALPSSIGALSAYDAVALIDVPKRAVPQQTQSALARYVHDLGRGLLMVGGTNGFGAGGWRDTPIEQALPVSMDIPTRYKLPPASIVVLIDSSGSMGVEEGGRTKIQLAADGAAKIAALMRDEDDITVIPFDSAPGKVVGPLPGSKRDQAIAALGKVEPGGSGIDIHDGLLEAERYINQSTKPVRHIITITDGDDTVQQEGALEIIQRLRAQQVTLTSLAVGDGKDVTFLKGAVAAGGGRFFLTKRAAEIPTILTDEAQAVIQPYIIEKAFAPVQTAEQPILRGITAVPMLKGLVLTSPKATAQVLLATPDGEPILATWQYGLGHTAAWTSDFRGQWASDWVKWANFSRFAAQLNTWLLPQPSSQMLTVQPATINGQLVLDVQAQDMQGHPRAGLNVVGQLLRGSAAPMSVPLREVGPGRYRAAVSDAPPGAYLLQILATDNQGNTVGAVTAGAVVPQSAEYRSQGANPGLLRVLAAISGGRVTPAPQATFDPNLAARGTVSDIALPLLLLALLLLPFDIATRRLFGWQRKPVGKAPVLVAQPIAPIAMVPQAAASQPSKSKANQRASELEKLREAQEQARKRARGEE